jgi:hypothetical protein
MSLTETELEQMRRIYHSEYGYLQVSEKRGFYTVDKKTAQMLVEKGLADYNHSAMTRFCQLTRAGICALMEAGDALAIAKNSSQDS